jgi:CRISPR-associated protein Cmr6
MAKQKTNPQEDWKAALSVKFNRPVSTPSTNQETDKKVTQQMLQIMNSSEGNLGWEYYKAYFQGIHTTQGQQKIIDRNKSLLTRPLPLENHLFRTVVEDSGFELCTAYPGLVTGTGTTHETGKAEGEFKLGFAFDHTTGVPYIPGASIKGKLRSFFPDYLRQQAKDKKDSKAKQDLNGVAQHREDYMLYVINVLLKDELGLEKELDNSQITELEKDIFEGFRYNEKTKKYEPKNTYQRDVFLDAYVCKAEKGLLGSDSITPHPHPLKNPIPITFLKILPKVYFHFQFDVKDCQFGEVIFKSEHKIKLFKFLLQQHGIGAKTRVGYGQFEI